jgi:hypothetical protein
MRESIQDLQKKLKQINTSSTPKPRPDRSNSFETISMHDTSSYSGSYIGVSGVRSSMYSPNTEADISSVDSNPRYQRGGGRFNTFRDNNSQASHNSSRSSLTSATRRPRLHSRHNNNKQDNNQQNHSRSSQHNNYGEGSGYTGAAPMYLDCNRSSHPYPYLATVVIVFLLGGLLIVIVQFGSFSP